MITIRIDEATGADVAEVVTTKGGTEEFKGTIPTRTLAENLLTHIARVKGARGEGWINLLNPPANTAWKLGGNGKLTAVTYFPPRTVEMKMNHPFVRDMGTREMREQEVCVRPVTLPGCVWTATWEMSGGISNTGFMLCPDPPNAGDFLNTPLKSFDLGNVYERGGLCWGNAAPTAPLGNLYALDDLFFRGSINNFHIERHRDARNWWGRVFFGLSSTEEWARLLQTPAPAGGWTWEKILEAKILPNLPEIAIVPFGATSSTIASLISRGGD